MGESTSQNNASKAGEKTQAQESPSLTRQILSVMVIASARRLNLEVPISQERKLWNVYPVLQMAERASTPWSTPRCQALGCLETWPLCRPWGAMVMKSRMQWELDDIRFWYPTVHAMHCGRGTAAQICNLPSLGSAHK